MYRAPGPKFKGSAEDISTEMIYYNWVDQFDVLGLGRNVPIATGTGSESLLALLPESRQWVVLHVPYPMGFYHRGVDGRIDDPEARAGRAGGSGRTTGNTRRGTTKAAKARRARR